MKNLPNEFVKNYDKSGDNRFLQVKMVPTPSLNCYIYRREKMDGSFVSFEVFQAKQRFAGQALPGGLVEEVDREVYPTANHFGFSAKETRNLDRAEFLLQEFVDELKKKDDKKNGVTPVEDESFAALVSQKLDVTPKARGRKRKERPELVYPVESKWSMKDLLKINNGNWNQPLIYAALQTEIKLGRIVEVARVKNESGRGRAAVVYSKATV